MNIGKKIIAGVVASSLLIVQFSFSYANLESITLDEKANIQAEVLRLQGQLFDNTKTYVEKLTQDFKKMTHYEETGDSKIEFEIDEATLGKGFASFDMKNYVVKNAALNSDISGDISLKTRYQPTYGTGMELDLSSFFFMISKDGEIYTLLKDFDFKVNDENISQILDVLKKQFEENKYLKLPSDVNTQLVYQYINNLRLDTILNETQNVLSQPLFQAYQKSGDKYLLAPTKYACDTYFELDKKLNFYNSWYTPKSCSSTVYKSFLKEFLSLGQMYIILGDEKNTLGYEAKIDGTQVGFTIEYTPQNIVAVNIDVVPDQVKYKNEGFTFSYVKGKSITSQFNAEEGKYTASLDSKLDTNNNIVSLDSKINFNNDFVGNFAIADKKISGFYSIKQRGYNYESDDWEYVLKNVYGISISGNLKADNTLEKLNIKSAGVDVNTKGVLFTAKASYENGNYIFNISAEGVGLQGKGYVSKELFTLNSQYDFNGFYTGEFNMNYDLSNNRNNLDLYFDVNQMDEQIAKLIISNIATRTYKEDVKIEVPSDFNELDMESLDWMNY
ncbi:MAG: hypothetical protein AB7E37_00995 [Candidatus Altimarinota bacterium]